jgi:hypothetical protein
MTKHGGALTCQLTAPFGSLHPHQMAPSAYLPPTALSGCLRMRTLSLEPAEPPTTAIGAMVRAIQMPPHIRGLAAVNAVTSHQAPHHQMGVANGIKSTSTAHESWTRRRSTIGMKWRDRTPRPTTTTGRRRRRNKNVYVKCNCFLI